jgi:hypothetical protein
MSQILREKQDMTYLSWSRIRHSSGTPIMLQTNVPESISDDCDHYSNHYSNHW